MSILFALVTALGFGAGDFSAGLAARRLDVRVSTLMVQALVTLAAIVAVLLSSGDGLTGHVMVWGAAAGVANGFAVTLLYYGLAVGRMSIVATLTGLIGAVLPILVGVVRGDPLSALSAAGIVLAIPAIALVSWHPASGGAAKSSGAIWGSLAGIGGGIYYIALDQAGHASGAWPIAVTQVVSVLVLIPLALRSLLAERPTLGRSSLAPVLFAGLGVGIATIALQAAFNSGGQLAIVVVVFSLYPGVTALFARFILAEHWIITQRIGLLAALTAVVLVSIGSN
ncbi:MAG: DMT family transporter [Actinobacteria bacterium]|nr:DMT family transporter [Actinomycetota bacterium]